MIDDTMDSSLTEIDVLQRKLKDSLLFNEQLKAVVLMLDEKLQDHEQSEPKEKENLLSTAKIDELTTALQNLKWGFREREESLSKELDIHKKAVLYLYAAHKKVRGYLKNACNSLCSHLVTLEEFQEMKLNHSNMLQEVTEANTTAMNKLQSLLAENSELRDGLQAFQSQSVDDFKHTSSALGTDDGNDDTVVVMQSPRSFSASIDEPEGNQKYTFPRISASKSSIIAEQRIREVELENKILVGKLASREVDLISRNDQIETLKTQLQNATTSQNSLQRQLDDLSSNIATSQQEQQLSVSRDTEKNFEISHLQDHINILLKENETLTQQLQTKEKEYSRMGTSLMNAQLDASAEKRTAMDLQKTLTDEANAARNKQQALQNAVTIAFKDIKIIKSDWRNEKDNTIASNLEMRKHIESYKEKISICVNEVTHIKEDYQAKCGEAKALHNRVRELEQSLVDIVEECQLQLQKQASINASLYDERDMLQAKIEELSAMSHKDNDELNILVENLTYELEFKTENLAEAEKKIQELGKLLVKTQKQYQRSNDGLQNESEALRLHIAELKCALNSAHEKDASVLAEIEDLKLQWQQREAVLKADVVGAQAETKQWCDKEAASREQLQQVVDVVGKMQSKLVAIQDENLERKKEVEDLLAEMDVSQSKQQELEKDLEDANKKIEMLTEKRIREQEETTLLQNMLKDKESLALKDSDQLKELQERVQSLVEDLDEKLEQIRQLSEENKHLQLISVKDNRQSECKENMNITNASQQKPSDELKEENSEAAGKDNHHRDVSSLKLKLFDANTKLASYDQQDSELMKDIDESKLKLGRTLYKLNVQFKKRKKLLSKHSDNTRSPMIDNAGDLDSNSPSPLKSKKSMDMPTTDLLMKLELKEKLILSLQSQLNVAHNAMNDDIIVPSSPSFMNKSMDINNSFDSLSISPQSLSISAIQGVYATEKEIVSLRKKLAAAASIERKNERSIHPMSRLGLGSIMENEDSANNRSFMKIEKAGDKNLNSLLAFTADGDIDFEDSSSPAVAPHHKSRLNSYSNSPSPVKDKTSKDRKRNGSRVSSPSNELVSLRDELKKSQARELELVKNTKILEAERDLLHEKIRTVMEGDTSSFNLKLYSLDGEFPLESPTKTMALVLSFVENNNKLLAKIDELERQVHISTTQKESEDLQERTARAELSQCQLRNMKLIEALATANEQRKQSDEELQELRDEVASLKNKLMAIGRENQLLKLQSPSFC